MSGAVSRAVTLKLDAGDRSMLATAIERLINLLDEIDGDSDFEPSLGEPPRVLNGII